jgi:hypothetical protein
VAQKLLWQLAMNLLPSSLHVRGLLGFALAFGLLASACKTDSSSAATNDSGPGPDPVPTCEPTTTPGESVLVACTKKIELDVAADGLPVPRPEGSTCDLSATYTLTLATRTLTWRECDREDQAGSPWVELTGERVLSQAQHDALLDVLRSIEVQAPSNACGADKSTITVSIETDAGSQEYRDAFYACRGGRIAVAPVDPAVAAFAELAVEEEPLCCDAIPQCDEGVSYATREACEASESECESHDMCCSTIWCALESDDDAGTHDDDAGL